MKRSYDTCIICSWNLGSRKRYMQRIVGYSYVIHSFAPFHDCVLSATTSFLFFSSRAHTTLRDVKVCGKSLPCPSSNVYEQFFIIFPRFFMLCCQYISTQIDRLMIYNRRWNGTRLHNIYYCSDECPLFTLW
jgi:hypothetical protein